MDVRSKARVSTPFPSCLITMNPYLDQFFWTICAGQVCLLSCDNFSSGFFTRKILSSLAFSQNQKSFQVHDSSSDCLLLIRRCPDLWMILASFRNGTSTAPAQARLRVTTVKSSFGTMLLTPFFISTLTCVPCR